MLRSLRASRAPATLVALLVLALSFSRAWATGRDFVDETMVAEGMRRGEVGVEFGSDARLDKFDRLQGWFLGAIETGLTSRWVLEAEGLALHRGRGLETAGWRAETRYVLLDGRTFPIAAAAAVEREVETSAAKHPLYERALISKLVLTRTFGGSLLVTVNGGLARLIDPVGRSAFAWAAGARWPDRGGVAAGVEITREPLDGMTRLVPQASVKLPGEMRVRLGTAFGLRGPYTFIARAIVEKELEL